MQIDKKLHHELWIWNERIYNDLMLHCARKNHLEYERVNTEMDYTYLYVQ